MHKQMAPEPWHMTLSLQSDHLCFFIAQFLFQSNLRDILLQEGFPTIPLSSLKHYVYSVLIITVQLPHPSYETLRQGQICLSLVALFPEKLAQNKWVDE